MTNLHLAIRTGNPQAMIHFFRNIFGFCVLEEFAADDDSFRLYFLSDTEQPKLELIFNRRPPIAEENATLSHYGFFVADYGHVLRASKATQLPILNEKQVNGRGQFYVQDPDGNYVEVNQA